MFWRFGGYAQLSSLDSVLDKPDVTVEELLDESDLIQELKQQNSKLIEYLRDEKVLDRLLRYVIAAKPAPTPEEDVASSSESGEKGRSASRDSFFGKVTSKARSASITKSDAGADEDKDEKQRMKYAYVSCEILSSEVWSISEAVLENPESLREFWGYIKQPSPLDPVQAGYFSKVNESLFDRKMEEMTEFFKSIPNVVPDLLQHVDCPMIMDLLLKIISLEKSEGGQGIVDWLQSQDLIPRLLAHLSPEQSQSTQTSAGDFIKAIITISANATTQDQSVIGPNELTRQLVSEPCIKQLIEVMLKGGNPLTVGVGIIIEVIRKNNSDYDLENQIGPVPKNSDPIYLGTLLRQFAKHIPQFMELVHNPNKTVINQDGTTATRKRELKTAFGEKIEPLGFDRFKTCELMAELLHCSNMALLNERGSEAEVKRRDAERERLKAEGKLTPKSDNNAGDFSTSVDSHGFHHARAPSSEAPEVVKRLEIQNNSEDDFEKVNVPETVSEEKDKDSESSPKKNTPDKDDGEFVDEPLSPVRETKDASPEATTPTKLADDAESPTSAGLSSRVGGLDLDNDTVMSDRADETADKKETSTETGAKEAPPSLLTQQLHKEGLEPPETLSPHPDDKPAPLFSGRRTEEAEKEPKQAEPDASRFIGGVAESEGSEVTPIDETSSQRSVLLGGMEGQYAPQYEVDIDGSPVVGDLLKMTFVENKVVPTILDFFFRFPWNNFLHNVVYDVVQQVFNGLMDRGYNRSLAIDLFETGRITDRIIEGQEASDKAQAETHMRLGYMGHLTLIAEEVLKFSERHPPELMSQSVMDKVNSQAWIDYVENTLAETRERDNAILGGVRPDMSIGPRQAVLNAVNAASNFGNDGSSSLASAGLSGNGSIGLDSMELANQDNSSGGYTFSGGALLSGFTNSSDEEDEEMDEGDGEREQRDREKATNTPSATTSSKSDKPETPDSSSSAKVPPPLQTAPSRARRLFAARVAQREAEREAREKAGEGESLEVPMVGDMAGEGEEGAQSPVGYSPSPMFSPSAGSSSFGSGSGSGSGSAGFTIDGGMRWKGETTSTQRLANLFEGMSGSDSGDGSGSGSDGGDEKEKEKDKREGGDAVGKGKEAGEAKEGA